jgi:beta-glucanase (GH16 family)
MKDSTRKIILLFSKLLLVCGLLYLIIPETISCYVGLDKLNSLSADYVNDLSLCLFIMAICSFLIFYFNKKARTLFFNFSLFFLFLGLAEFYTSYKSIHNNPRRNLKVINPDNYFCGSDKLGYAMYQNTVIEKEYLDTMCVYNAKYTIDRSGYRETSPLSVNASDTASSIVFFGCSYTFGMGLSDYQTMPYIVQNYVKDRYKVYNLGVSGYGPNQMLSAIENNMLDSIVKGKPRIFIFTAITDHINRVYALNLKASKHEHVPKYVIDEKNNRLKYEGLYDDPQNLMESRWFSKIIKSGMCGYITKKAIDKKNSQLVLAIISKSKELLLKKYPGSQFYVIYWDNVQDNNDSAIISGLRKNGVNVHLASTILPGYSSDKFPLYMIYFPYECHPCYQANKLLSEYIVEKLISPYKTDYRETNNLPYIDHFEILDKNYWNIQQFSFPLNDCEMIPSQVKCDNSGLSLIVSENSWNDNSAGKQGVDSLKKIKPKKETIIIEKKNFKGGGIYSNNFLKYGEFSACIKNSKTSGTVSFFTLMNKWKDKDWIQKDIDFSFLGKSPRQVLVSVKIARKKKPESYSQVFSLDFNSSEAFHTYTIRWTEDSISFKVDGKWLGSEKQVRIDEEMNVILNHWTGPQNDPNIIGWMGKLDKSKLPSELKINYVSYKPVSE